MRIIPLKPKSRLWNGNSYLVLGDWNCGGDTNTVIDPGDDLYALDEIERLSAMFGAIPIRQVILTHSHGHNFESALAFKERFNARVLAFGDTAEVDESLSDGQIIMAGDQVLEVLHAPDFHHDTICLYAPSEKILFSGDTGLRVERPGGSYRQGYVEALFKIACRDILKIFPGYDEPLTHDCQEMIIQTVRNVCRSEIVENDAAR